MRTHTHTQTWTALVTGKCINHWASWTVLTDLIYIIFRFLPPLTHITSPHLPLSASTYQYLQGGHCCWVALSGSARNCCEQRVSHYCYPMLDIHHPGTRSTHTDKYKMLFLGEKKVKKKKTCMEISQMYRYTGVINMPMLSKLSAWLWSKVTKRSRSENHGNKNSVVQQYIVNKNCLQFT